MLQTGLRLFLVIAILGLAPFPAVTAQHQTHQAIGQEDNTVVVGDAPTDVELIVAPKVGGVRQNASQVPGDQFAHLDILKVVFSKETENSFDVSFQLRAITVPTGQFANRYVTFAYGRVDWLISVRRCSGGSQQQQGPDVYGCLQWKDSSSRGYRSQVSIKAVTTPDGTITWTVPKDAIFDHNRVPGRFGGTLSNISASTDQVYGSMGWGGGQSGQGSQLDATGGIHATDRAPRDGFSEKTFLFNQGSGGVGHIGINAAEPIRVSNGEATTIVYKVDLFNHHTEPLSVEMSTSDLRKDWTARVPALLSLEPQSTMTVPVILALPFTHDHGKTALFKVHAQAVEEAGSHAVLDLGVFWTDVPQPSAHHECESDDACGTWFHAAPSDDNFPPEALNPVLQNRDGWMNGVADDPDEAADDGNVPAFFNEGYGCLFFQFASCASNVPPRNQVTWFFPLSPSLLLGLDFDVKKEGSAKIVILPQVPASTATLSVELVYCDPTSQNRGPGGGGGNQTCFDYRTLLAKGQVTGALAQGQARTFDVPLTVETTADIIPYRRGANIGLRVRLVTDNPQAAVGAPKVEFVTKASHLHLPLIEYHDPIDAAFLGLGSIELTAQDGFEKRVNPGRSAVFRFDLANKATKTQAINVEVQGVKVEWMTVIGETLIEMEPGERRNFTVVITAPDDAAIDERAELFVVAQNVDDPAIVAVSRLRATVVDKDVEDIPDEFHLASADKKDGGGIPGFEGFFLLFAAAAALIVGRRRRLA